MRAERVAVEDLDEGGGEQDVQRAGQDRPVREQVRDGRY